MYCTTCLFYLLWILFICLIPLLKIVLHNMFVLCVVDFLYFDSTTKTFIGQHVCSLCCVFDLFMFDSTTNFFLLHNLFVLRVVVFIYLCLIPLLWQIFVNAWWVWYDNNCCAFIKHVFLIERQMVQDKVYLVCNYYVYLENFSRLTSLLKD